MAGHKDRSGPEMIRSYQASIPNYVTYDGVPFPGSILTKRFSDIKGFHVRPDDVIVCGYPRSGNHWLKEIVTCLYADDNPQHPDANNKHVFERIPLLEMAIDLKQCMETYMENYFQKFGPMKPMLSKIATKIGLASSEKMFSGIFLDPLEDLEKRRSPRLYHTHLPYRLLPDDAKTEQGKLIYVYRNGKDAAVSFYEMHKMYPPFGYYSGDWKEFFYSYLSGKVCFGSWFVHLKDWWAHRNKRNILFVAYEDMIEDLPREVGRIAQFLEKDIPVETVREIAQKCTFSKMKSNPMSTYDGLHHAIDTRKTTFLRRGKVADWKSKLTVEDSELFDILLHEHSKDGLPEVRFQLDT